uniref:Protein kinase domain-containing protein n=1 Tax=Meloidogyne hapla TaxID=6305 RepID=A0A1I8BD61_MELHA
MVEMKEWKNIRDRFLKINSSYKDIMEKQKLICGNTKTFSHDEFVVNKQGKKMMRKQSRVSKCKCGKEFICEMIPVSFSNGEANEDILVSKLPLGNGAFAVVYHATYMPNWENTGDCIALKVAHSLSRNPQDEKLAKDALSNENILLNHIWQNQPFPNRLIKYFGM